MSSRCDDWDSKDWDDKFHPKQGWKKFNENYKQRQNKARSFTVTEIDTFIEASKNTKDQKKQAEASKDKHTAESTKNDAKQAETSRDKHTVATSENDAEKIPFKTGSKGKVFIGEIDRIEVAIKGILVKEEYEKERKNMEALANHPQIVQYIGCATIGEGEEDKRKVPERYSYIVMELMPKCLAEEYRKKDFQWKSLTQALIQIGEGLQYIHNSGNIYYDLKPPNILMDEEETIIKLCDLGSVGTKENPGAVTFGYHPKDIDSITDITEKVDVFSFGITCLQLIMKHDPGSIGNNKARVAVNKTNKDKNITSKALWLQQKYKHAVESSYLERNGGGCSEEEAVNITRLALKCSEPLAVKRSTLEEILIVLAPLEDRDRVAGVKPPYSEVGAGQASGKGKGKEGKAVPATEEFINSKSSDRKSKGKGRQ